MQVLVMVADFVHPINKENAQGWLSEGDACPVSRPSSMARCSFRPAIPCSFQRYLKVPLCLLGRTVSTQATLPHHLGFRVSRNTLLQECLFEFRHLFTQGDE